MNILTIDKEENDKVIELAAEALAQIFIQQVNSKKDVVNEKIEGKYGESNE